MAAHFIIGLDIGTASLKLAVLERVKGAKPALRLLAKYPSAGLRKGAIVDLPDASQAVARALQDAKKFSRHALGNIYVGIGTPQIKAQLSRGITAVSRVDAEIYQDDIDRVVRASQAVNVGPNRMIIHNVNREFIVDGVGDIRDPLGLSGSRLEVMSLVVDAFAPHVKAIMRAVELSGGELAGLLSAPIVAGKASLSKSQRDLGTVVIDMGHGTTGMSVYEEDKLLGVGIFPVGAGHITNDLAVGLKIPVEAAEALKLAHGYALAKDINYKESIELKKFVPDAKAQISRRYIAEIIESRLAEILELVNNELTLLGRAGQLAGGVVVTGGGAKLAGLTELVKQELKLSSQVGLPSIGALVTGIHAFPAEVEDPEFVNVLGLALHGLEDEGWGEAKGSAFGFAKLVKYFMP